MKRIGIPNICFSYPRANEILKSFLLISGTFLLYWSMRSDNQSNMAASSTSKITKCLHFKPTFTLHELFSAKSNSNLVKRIFHTLPRCSSSQVNEKVQQENGSPSLRGEFVNRNPRNVEYEGRNKPRGYGTQFSRRDYYNK